MTFETWFQQWQLDWRVSAARLWRVLGDNSRADAIVQEIVALLEQRIAR